MATPRRDHLLKTALALFNEHGFHATGIDRVQEVSGVSKTTMYKYFKTKEDLIRAVLELRHDEFTAWFDKRTLEIAEERYQTIPQGKLMAVFDALDEWIQSDTFFGCNFINASAEFSNIEHPIHRYSAEHKLGLAQYVKGFIPSLSEDTCQELSKEILLLIDGAIVCAHTTGMCDAAERAKKMMLMLLESYQRNSTN